jgi:type VI secretion system protein VasG
VGEPGVGKTALIEGLALAIVAGDVPDHLKNIELLSLDLGALQAGAGVKGEFENRLKNVINEVKASVKPIVLFIDEAHTIIGAGGAQGGSDAANLLKPALARGELRTIAATTWAEYKKYFEKDAALERRFQPVKVDEPSGGERRADAPRAARVFEKVHNVTVLDEAIISAVKLSARYISGRLLPDKAVDLLDTATARVKTDIDAKHDDLTSMESDLAGMRREQDGVSRDKAHGFKVDEERLGELTTKIAAREAEITEFQTRWSAQRDAVKAVLAARTAYTALKPGEDPAPATQALAEANATWDAMRAAEKALGRKALVNAEVNTDVVARIVGDWTGIPVGQMQKDDVAVLLSLEDRLRGRVKGQDHAMQTVGETIRISKAGINNPTQPIGRAALRGPLGRRQDRDGARARRPLYGGERFMTTINMSEFRRSTRSPGSSARRRATWATARAACSPRPCASARTPWCSSTRWRRPTSR